MKKISLVWADKFRQLHQDFNASSEVVHYFFEYIEKMEREFNERLANKEVYTVADEVLMEF